MTAQYDVTLVTYSKFPDLVPDDFFLRDALAERGFTVRAAVWDDPSVDWSASKVTVCRSLWDYFRKPLEFEAWIERVNVQTHLLNSAQTMKWNMHKGYLLDLLSRGIQTVPTHFCSAGTFVDVAAVCKANDWPDVVIKPAISGSSVGARRLKREQFGREAQDHIEDLLKHGDVMIQPYLAAVETERERSCIFIGDAFTHAILKAPFNAGAAGDVETRELRADLSNEEFDFARSVLDVLDEPTVYARVDFVPTGSGPQLMELELIEPSLFFEFAPHAAQSFADVLLGVLDSQTRGSLRA